jgi:hypothetical protein
VVAAAHQDAAPVRRTRWSATFDRTCPLPEYPRPQLVRDSYLNLNGVWRYAITNGPRPGEWDGDIVVPFSPEASLSEVGRRLLPGQTLWYCRPLGLPPGFAPTPDSRVLLHFGAVDQDCEVFIDDSPVGSNRGGYWPFSIDVTEHLRDGRTHVLTVAVVDETDAGFRSRGKQSLKPGGIWYTPQSGIWQTVWIEAVPALHVQRLQVQPLLEAGIVEVTVHASAEGEAVVGLHADGVEVGRARGPAGTPLRIPVPDMRVWSPEDPFLYDLTISIGSDEVTSYVGMRSFGVGLDQAGVPRLLLNGEPYFHAGVLDQGYWPDGLYTAPTDAALVHDIRSMKDLGFTMLRKHIKIEPLRWYHHCDRLGMLVWQDMVNGGRTYKPLVITAPVLTPLRLDDRMHRAFGRQDGAGRDEFGRELEDTIQLLQNVTSIACWVPFNEGWGQFDAAAAVERIRELDPHRVIDHASGWHDQRSGDLRSLHVYFRAIRPARNWGKDGRAVVVSEYGGYSLRLDGHEFSRREFGYRKTATPEAFTDAFETLHRNEVAPAIARGLSAIVYTQLSDVEDELNGLLTADRSVVKADPARVLAVVRELRAEFERRANDSIGGR